MTTTQNLHLPQFAAADRIHHDDFNNAFAALDAAVAANSSALAGKADAAALAQKADSASVAALSGDVNTLREKAGWQLLHTTELTENSQNFTLDLSEIDFRQWGALYLVAATQFTASGTTYRMGFNGSSGDACPFGSSATLRGSMILVCYPMFTDSLCISGVCSAMGENTNTYYYGNYYSNLEYFYFTCTGGQFAPGTTFRLYGVR